MVLKCRFGTSNGSGTENGYGGRRTLPYVFTEQGMNLIEDAGIVRDILQRLELETEE